MLTLELRLLGGRYAATEYNDRARAEWPPHPARVYCALVAALHDGEGPTEDERRALEWLAGVGAPAVVASGAAHRRSADVYVPIIPSSPLGPVDRQILAVGEAEAALAEPGLVGKARVAAEKRLRKAESQLLQRSVESAVADGKGNASSADLVLNPRKEPQPRRFPVALPHDDVVHLSWDADVDDEALTALDRVAARVARLGHSSSLVAARFFTGGVEDFGRTRWVPDPRGQLPLRVPHPDQLTRLEQAHQFHQQVHPRVLPCAFAAYSDAADRATLPDPLGSADDADGWIVFEVVAVGGGRRHLLDLSLAQCVARAFRGALLRHATQWPASLTGHEDEGGPARCAHLAYVALGDVGHDHATGSILGIALVPPRGLAPADRAAMIRGVAAAESAGETDGQPTVRLALGRADVLHLRRAHAPVQKTLQAASYTRPARRWATATAVALERNPGNLRSRDPHVVERAVAHAEESVALACLHAGLPRPMAVWVHWRSLLDGAPPARRFMPFPSEGSGPRRVCVHAEVVFDQPVRGPILLGAGRYFGLGLCRPLAPR